MHQSKAPYVHLDAVPGERLRQMVEDLDKYAGANHVNDWELSFIADMHDRKVKSQPYFGGQTAHIIRLWEKYCA